MNLKMTQLWSSSAPGRDISLTSDCFLYVRLFTNSVILSATMRVSIGSRHALRSAHNFRVSPSTLRRQTTLASSSSSGSTVNPDEIAHFSRLSAQWWDERGEFGMLHKMNPVRTQFVREKLVRHKIVRHIVSAIHGGVW